VVAWLFNDTVLKCSTYAYTAPNEEEFYQDCYAYEGYKLGCRCLFEGWTICLEVALTSQDYAEKTGSIIHEGFELVIPVFMLT
jgi:hypothetical protein